MRKYLINSIILLFLLILLSFSVQAAGIKKVSVVGDDGIEGFFKIGDKMHYSVIATLDGPEITTSMVKVSTGMNTYSFEQFCSESKSSTLLQTSLEYGENAYEIKCVDAGTPSGEFFVDIILFNSAGIEIDRKPYTLAMDSQPPVPVLDSVNQRGQNINFSYTVSDSACTGCTGCAGISRVELWIDDAKKETIEINGESNNCSFSRTDPISSLQSGEYEFYIMAYDNFGLLGTSNILLQYVDFSAPVLPNTFKLYKGGEELTHVATSGPSSQVHDVQIILEVQDNNLESLTGDLSNLNTENPLSNSYKNMEVDVKRDCEVVENTYNCSFPGITLKLSSPSASISVTAVDSSGNSAVKTIVSTIGADDTGPVSTFLGTENCFEGKCYLKKGPVKISSTLSDSGAGLARGLIYFTLEDVMDNPSRVYECNNTGTAWDCYGSWTVGKLASGKILDLDMTAPSRDDAGNEPTGEEHVQVMYDDEAPVIVNVTYYDKAKKNYLVKGDTVVFEMNITDADSGIATITALLNHSSIKESDTFMNAMSCESKSTGLYTCKWEVSDVEAAGSTQVFFNITDLAGNPAKNNKPLDIMIYGISSSTDEPNYFNYKPDSLAPEFIEQSMTPYIQYKLFSTFKQVDLSSGKATALDITWEQDNCELVNPSAYLYKDELYDKSDLKMPVSLFTLDSIEVTDNKLELNCSFKVTSAYEGEIMPPETENMIIEIPVNNNLKPMTDQFVEKIQDTTGMINNNWNWITKLNGVVVFAKSICSFSMNVGRIDAALAQIRAALYAPLLILKQFDSGSTADDVWGYVNTGYCEINAVAQKINQYTMKPVACVNNVKGVDLIKGLCSQLRCDKCFFGAGAFKSEDKIRAEFLPKVHNLGLGDGVYNNKVFDFAQKNLGMPSLEQSAPSVEQSYITAVACGCIPALLKHVAAYRQLECTYVECMYAATSSGVNTEACEFALKSDTCMFFMSPAMEILPIFKWVDALKGWVKEWLENAPAHGLSYVIGGVCGDYWTVLAGVQKNWGIQAEKKPQELPNGATYDPCSLKKPPKEYETFDKEKCKEIELMPELDTKELAKLSNLKNIKNLDEYHWLKHVFCGGISGAMAVSASVDEVKRAIDVENWLSISEISGTNDVCNRETVKKVMDAVDKYKEEGSVDGTTGDGSTSSIGF